MSQTIAITGASGHLGTALILALLEKGNVTIKAQFHTAHPPITHPSLSWIQGDLSRVSLNTLFENAEVVIHCAAHISIDGDPEGKVYDTNVTGTSQVIEACVTQKVIRLMHISSTHALEEYPHTSPFDETRPYKTSTGLAYDYTKALGEQLVLEAMKDKGLEVVILRPSSLMGLPDYKGSLLGNALQQFSRGTLPILVEGGYSFVDVRDVAAAIITAIDKGRSGESYNLTGTDLSTKELAMLCATIGGGRPPLLTLPHWIVLPFIPFVKVYSHLTKTSIPFTRESLHILKSAHPCMGHEKATRELAFHPRPITETIQDYINWCTTKENSDE